MKTTNNSVVINQFIFSMGKIFKYYILCNNIHFYRPALEEFNRKHYANAHFAFDGRRNMYCTKELKSVCLIINNTYF